MLDHPADAGIERVVAAGLFDPWAAEAEFNAQATRHLDVQNEADCEEADERGELNPDMDRWYEAAEEELAGWGDPPGPKPPVFHARGGAASALIKPEPATADEWPLEPHDLEYDPPVAAPSTPNDDCWPWYEPPAGVWNDASTGTARRPERRVDRSDVSTVTTRRLERRVDWNGASTISTTSTASVKQMFGGGRARLSAKEEKLQRVLEKADRLGLLGDMPGQEALREGESALVRDLRLGMLQRARETYDVGRLSTSLDWFEEFQIDTQRAPIFRPLEHSGDIEAMVYNQETLDMFSEYIRRRGSRLVGRRGGDPVKSDTVATYVGQIKKLRTHEAHYAITDPSVNVIASAAHKRMRQLDGPAGERRLSLGLRARHLRMAAELGFDRTSKQGVIEWGAALTAHNLLCRGGEVGVCETAELDPERDLTLGAIEFKEPGEVSEGLPWLTAEFVPIKDTTVRRRSAVMPVRRRAAGGRMGSDPMDTYDAIVLAMAARLGRMPPARGRVEGPEAALPLFVGLRGKPWNTADTRRLARRIAGSLDGLDESLFGAKSFRIGGATDYRAVYGPGAAERMIRQRGRWWSDIHALYQRALATEHLQGSAAIGDARGAELEALCKGWAQPANFR